MTNKFTIGLLFTFSVSTFAKDGKWVWNDNSRSNRGRNADEDGFRREKSANPRYDVYENQDYEPNVQFNDRPLFPGPGLNVNRPLLPQPEYPNRPINNRPIYPGPGFVGPHRPGGVYGNNQFPQGGYGQGGALGRPDVHGDQGILTGPIPSWVQQGPFKNFDTCKCTERFNCRSPGLSYGHCDVGKKYCCYNRNKIEDLGSDYPSRPVHSPANGVLVGPGGPVDGFSRPGGEFARPGNGFGRPGLIGTRPGFGVQNGVLVGPNGRNQDRRRDI
ncbi:hypothetical protein HHI36_021027 [Cryptolaemus montrouzieri]|uniref:Uncharacterized protein n=1 Tax=Cryptolaemus montrouzieri TaxID=559131 RepID=A0ABD2MWF1_9CUCU